MNGRTAIKQIASLAAVLWANLAFAKMYPTAIWSNGEFADSAGLHGGYALRINASNSIDENGNIVIGKDATAGVAIDLAAVTNCTMASVLVMYRLPAGGAPVTNAVLASVVTAKTRFGAVCTNLSGRSVLGYLPTSKLHIYDFAGQAPTVSDGDGCMLFSYSPKGADNYGMRVYLGENVYNLPGGIITGIAGASSDLATISIGGPDSAGIVSPWAGMEIKYIALFAGESLSPEDLVDWSLSFGEIPSTVSQETILQENVIVDDSGEWAEIGSKPIFISVSSQTNVFTIAFEADVPDGEGTIFGLNQPMDIRVRRMADGKVNAFAGAPSPEETSGLGKVVSGRHQFLIEYNNRLSLDQYSSYGITVYVDGERVYSSADIVTSRRRVPFLSIGGAAVKTEYIDVFTGLKVRNLRFWDGFRPGTLFSVY